MNQNKNLVVNEKEEQEVVEKVAWYKSLGFWIGIGGVVLTATGHEVADFQTWAAIGNFIVDTVKNPATLVGIGMAVYGVFNSTKIKGLY